MTLGPEGQPMPLLQAGALCWRMHRDRVQVLLITSRDTGRWVIPKGWPVEGLGAAEGAAREAWEEAGVEGAADPLPVGNFDYGKVLAGQAVAPCTVQVFALRVRRLAESYPERGQRRRKWFGLRKAAGKVQEPGLRRLILGFGAPEPDKGRTADAVDSPADRSGPGSGP